MKSHLQCIQTSVTIDQSVRCNHYPRNSKWNFFKLSANSAFLFSGIGPQTKGWNRREIKFELFLTGENLWKGIRVSLGTILRLYYQQRKEIMIFCGFRRFREFRGIDLAQMFCIFSADLLLKILSAVNECAEQHSIQKFHHFPCGEFFSKCKENLWKWCIYWKNPHEEIRWNFCT